jgi:hypothetical protein
MVASTHTCRRVNYVRRHTPAIVWRHSSAHRRYDGVRDNRHRNDPGGSLPKPIAAPSRFGSDHGALRAAYRVFRSTPSRVSRSRRASEAMTSMQPHDLSSSPSRSAMLICPRA